MNSVLIWATTGMLAQACAAGLYWAKRREERGWEGEKGGLRRATQENHQRSPLNAHPTRRCHFYTTTAAKTITMHISKSLCGGICPLTFVGLPLPPPRTKCLWGQLLHFFCQESGDAMGGWKKEGGGKPHEWHPSQKGVLDLPRTVGFPPPSGVSALFFLYKNPRQSRPEALLEGPKNFREGAFSGTFSSPHTFCTPPYHGPIFTKTIFRGNSFVIITKTLCFS